MIKWIMQIIVFIKYIMAAFRKSMRRPRKIKSSRRSRKTRTYRKTKRYYNRKNGGAIIDPNKLEEKTDEDKPVNNTQDYIMNDTHDNDAPLLSDYKDEQFEQCNWNKNDKYTHTSIDNFDTITRYSNYKYKISEEKNLWEKENPFYVD